jgi:hypothetical protein
MEEEQTIPNTKIKRKQFCIGAKNDKNTIF